MLRAVAPHIARWNHEPAGERGHGAAAASADCEDGDDVDGSDDTYACQHKKCQISNGMQLHALAAMPSTIPFAI